MNKVCVLTDFGSHDSAYSLCRVVANQIKMIAGLGRLACKVIVNRRFNDDDAYPGAEVVGIDPGPTSNTVYVTEQSGTEIEHLTNQLSEALEDVGVVLTHDLIYQAVMWKHHAAARRVARQRPDLEWLHWVHSATLSTVAEECGAFAAELRGPFPNSTLVVMHPEEKLRKMEAAGFPAHDTVIIPNPIDLTAHYHPAALEVIERADLWLADCVMAYPCRLDRGKQPHILIELAAELVKQNVDARVVIIDFHSVSGDKATYRNEMNAQARQAGVPLLFTSDLEYEGAGYCIPHKAVMNLFEFADVLVHPSKSESDPLIVPEAMWKRCGLVFNFDLPVFRQWEKYALLYKWSSNIDVNTGMWGETKTEYGDRQGYMSMCAGGIQYLLQHDPVLSGHVRIRQERSLQAVWQKALWPILMTCDSLMPAGLATG